MIKNLTISNVALIEKATIDFSDNLNIITGETGVGKSLFIGALNFVMGEKPKGEFLRKGEREAKVSCIVEVENNNTKERLAELGVICDEENCVLIERTLNEKNKSSCKINGETKTIGVLKSVASQCIDIHSQHQHQLLLAQEKHITLLDVFCGDKLATLKHELSEKLKMYRKASLKIKELSGGDGDKATRLEIYKFQLEEIDNANIDDLDEEETLIARRSTLSNAQKIVDKVQFIKHNLFTKEENVWEITSSTENKFVELSEYENCDDLIEHMSSINALLEAVKIDVAKFDYLLDFDETEIDEINERLKILNDLKKKYGGTLEKVLEFRDTVAEKIDIIENADEEIEKLKVTQKKYKDSVTKYCQEINKVRVEYAVKIKDDILSSLSKVGMKDVKFDIEIEKQREVSANGFDKVTFMIATNKGGTLKPLNQIASGGEMSRVMLALKSALARFEDIDTYVFDEIDTGVSGRTAQMVAEEMKKLSKNNQIICITHLPQIASMADFHIIIEKFTDEVKTVTTINVLKEEESYKELARLIGGAKITDTTLKSAKEMKKMASEI